MANLQDFPSVRGVHDDFPIIKQSGYDFSGNERASPIQMQVQDYLHFEMTGQLSSGPINTNDELFDRLQSFEASLKSQVFEVDVFYGEVFDATWREYVEARHKAVNYRCKLGIIPHESVPSLFRIWQDSASRQQYYERIVPNYDYTSLLFAGAELQTIRDMFYEGHGDFHDDIHKAYFVAMFKKVFQIANLIQVDHKTFKPSYDTCTYEIYGALEPMELGTEHSAPAHAYMKLVPLSRLELYPPNLCDMCNLPCPHMVSEIQCTEYCRFVALEHAAALTKPAMYGRYLPQLQKPHVYCKQCFDRFCVIDHGIAQCALCNENDVVGDSPREIVDWQYGVNRGWVQNRYTTITGKPVPAAKPKTLTCVKVDENCDKLDDVEPVVKRFRKCFCCDSDAANPWCLPSWY